MNKHSKELIKALRSRPYKSPDEVWSAHREMKALLARCVRFARMKVKR